jgi:hypothetical protein
MGPEREHTWNYLTLIGMLYHLASSTCPDIAFAFHQCACFCTNPKHSHELAVCWIVQYLKCTSDEGYLLCPVDFALNWDCYVDANFSRIWMSSNSDNPTSVKSCTGYVITFASCPLLWPSKLQSDIDLPTTEAEYIALSQATCDIIPKRALLYRTASIAKWLLMIPSHTQPTLITIRVVLDWLMHLVFTL